MSARPLALVVEDSRDQAELLTRYLAREGYDTLVAQDAETAIASFDDIDPQVAIVDLLLPGIGGAECAERLRSRFPACSIVFSSVLDPHQYPPSGTHMPKPVTGERFREAIIGLRR